MTDLTVAKTILEQLGGRRFRAMTGASNFTGAENELIFMLPGNRGFVKNRINKVVVHLDPSDTYTVTFYRVAKGEGKMIETHSDIYCDELQECFTAATGLETRL
jgi:hypothetical protein